MTEYDILKTLSLATLLWMLFFINLLLPSTINTGRVMDVMMWNVLYMLLLIACLIVTMVVIGESIRNFKKHRMKSKEESYKI